MFLEHRNYDKVLEPFVFLTATKDENYVPGEVLVINAAGTATKCGATVTPQYICQTTLEKAPENAQICATLVNAMQELEVPLSAAGTALKVGNKVTIGTDGLTVTATTESGVFTIKEIVGTAVGDKVRGFFMR